MSEYLWTLESPRGQCPRRNLLLTSGNIEPTLDYRHGHRRETDKAIGSESVLGRQGWCEQPFAKNVDVSTNAIHDCCKLVRHAGLTRGLGLAINSRRDLDSTVL